MPPPKAELNFGFSIIEDCSAIFSYPDKMVFNLVNHVTPISVFHKSPSYFFPPLKIDRLKPIVLTLMVVK